MIDLFLFRTAIRDLSRPKRLAMAAALALLPVAIALLLRFADSESFDPTAVYNNVASTLLYGFLLVILSVVFCTGVITQEMEQKTIVYLLTRPVARWRICLVKFAAAILAITLTLTISALLLALATVGLGGRSGSSLLSTGDVTRPREFYDTIAAANDPISEYIKNRLSERARRSLFESAWAQRQPDLAAERLIRQVARRLRTDAAFYSEERFGGVDLPPSVQALAKTHPKDRDLVRLNRMLLEAAYPSLIQPRPEEPIPLGRDLLILPVGALAYGALFLFLATFVRRPLIIGILFAFGWEWWVPNMPGRFQFVSIMSYLRVLAPHPKPPAESIDLLQFLSGSNQETISSALSRGVLATVTVVALVGALAMFSLREFVPRDDAD
jgi:hypothetical protein